MNECENKPKKCEPENDIRLKALKKEEIWRKHVAKENY